MMSTSALPGRSVLWVLWILALALCFWIYKPGLEGPPLLDDAANLEVIQSLASGEGFALDVLRENRSGPLGRPLSMASFMVDLYWLDAGTRGAKLLNLLLHLVTGTLVFLFAAELFRALGVRRPDGHAMLVAALWLFAPLLLSSVLYIVQRMAQLATLFSLVSCWAYLRWRRPAVPFSYKSGWLVLAVLGIPLAVLSKENGLLTVPLLILIELAILQPRDRERDGQMSPHVRRLGRVHAVGLLVGSALVVGLLLLNPGWIENGYISRRSFDLPQRVLSELRILWIYIAQLLWVDSGALGVFHDGFLKSESLFSPPATALAAAGWLVAIPLSVKLLFIRSLRGVGFGLLFYLVAHAMESTIFPLELYFEHRNYLPAVGLFIALISLGVYLSARWAWARNWLLLLWSLVLAHSVLATAVEAEIWSDKSLFYVVAASRHPDSVRANESLAIRLADLGDLESALDYAARAEALEKPGLFRHRLREAFLYCASGAPLPAQSLADWRLGPADFADSLAVENSYVLVRKMIDGRCPSLDQAAVAEQLGAQILAVERTRVAAKLFLALAILENHLQRYDQALIYVDALLERTPGHQRALMMRLYFTQVLGLEEAYEQTLARLIEARDNGLLSAQQRYNLSVLTGDVAE